LIDGKALAARRREISSEERDQVTRLMAEGRSLTAISKEIGCGWARVKRIAESLEVIDAATRLRMTTMVPEMLDQLTGTMTRLAETALHIESRMTALEREMRAMNKAIFLEKIKKRDLIERNRTLREEIKGMRDLMRRRGVDYSPSR
jgi:phosphoribosyl-ATP pyrophosphohydrolase